MPIVRLPNGDLRDEIRQPLYDTLSVKGTDANATPNALDGQQFFSNIQGKRLWQTNLRQPNLLETAVSYRVQGLAVDAQYINTEVDAVAQSWLPMLQDFGAIIVHIGEKDYWNGPLNYVMGRVEQNASISTQQAVAADQTTGFVFQRTGATAVQGVILSGRHVVDINPLQSFYAALQVNVPAAIAALSSCILPGEDTVNVKFSFKGLQRRPVQ